MQGTKYIPELAPYNLCSVFHCLEEGFNLSNNGRMIVLKKGDFTLEFNREIKTKSGYEILLCHIDIYQEIIMLLYYFLYLPKIKYSPKLIVNDLKDTKQG